MFYEPKWEQIGETSTYRMKTPGGWLVFDSDEDAPGGICYVPDAGHDWNFLPPVEEEKPACSWYEAGLECIGREGFPCPKCSLFKEKELKPGDDSEEHF